MSRQNPPDPDGQIAPPPAPPLLLDRRFWHPVGYGLSALWMIGMLIVTNGNGKDPLFKYFFTVPLAGWIVGIAIGFAIKTFVIKKRRPGS